MYEDNYCPASIEQVEERLKNGEFQNDKELLEKYVAYKKQKMIIWKPSMESRQKKYSCKYDVDMYH